MRKCSPSFLFKKAIQASIQSRIAFLRKGVAPQQNAVSQGLMSLDVGNSLVGVSFTRRPASQTVVPLTTIKLHPNYVHKEQLKELISRFRPIGLVIGEPKGFPVSLTRVKDYKAMLDEDSNFDHLFYIEFDERRTTQIAQAIMIKVGYRHRFDLNGRMLNDKKLEDAYSAMIILRRYIEYISKHLGLYYYDLVAKHCGQASKPSIVVKHSGCPNSLHVRRYHSMHQKPTSEVYEWMRKKGIYKFSSSDHAVQFNLIWRVRGCSAAERYVKNLREKARCDKTNGEVLHCFVHKHRGHLWENPLLYLQKMKELGFVLSPCHFNEIMHICAYYRQMDEVPRVFAELKKSNVSPDNDSYRIGISSFGRKNDLDGMERMLREMETQPHIVMDWCTYAVVAEFYDRELLVDKATDALKKAEVILQKEGIGRKRPNYLLRTDYENVIKSLVKLGELDEAMKFVNEWDASGNWRDELDISIPYTIIEEYIKNGKLLEAFHTIEGWSRKGKRGVDRLSYLLCKEYLKAGNVIQAFNCFQGTQQCFKVHPVVPMMFFEYLEECGSFFPLRCCTKPARGTMFLNSTQALTNMESGNIIKSLVESGKLNEARKTVMEWVAYGNWHGSSDHWNILKLIIDGYCKKYLLMEAEAMAEAWTRGEKRSSQVAEIWFVLASHYQLHGKFVRGFKCLKRCLNLTPGLEGNYSMLFWTFMNGIEYSRGMMMNPRGEAAAATFRVV